MSSVGMISIEPVYAHQILARRKTIELRKSTMGFSPNDVVLVYTSAPDQQLSFWFRVGRIETLTIDEMWRRYADRLGIARDDYDAYFAGTDTATGLHVGELHRLKPVSLEEIQELVPGFSPLQGITWLRDEMGKFQRLLPKRSDPRPKDVLPQLTFGFSGKGL